MRARRLLRRCTAAALLALTSACGVVRYTGLPYLWRRAPALPPDSTAMHDGQVLVGAGDIAFCGIFGDEATAALVARIPGTVFTAGDNAYPESTTEYLERCYAPTWGRFKDRTRPAMGNHEYANGKPNADYFVYFGDRAGPPGVGYYSYQLGVWHVIVLDTNPDVSAGSEQERWLRADLAAHPDVCTVAYFHHPLFSSSGSATPRVRALYDDLYAARVDVVVTGHHHAYERFARQRPDGTRDDERGLRQIVVGTGGAGLDKFGHAAPNSEARIRRYGVLKLELYPGRYRWRFVSVDGRVRDQGEEVCR